MRSLSIPAIVALSVIVIGCGTPAAKNGSWEPRTNVESSLKIQASDCANPWTHLNLYNNPDNFQFAIVADRTSGHRPGVFAEAVRKLNLLKPEFVISIGDLIEGSSGDDAEVNQRWDELEGLVSKLQMPFFYVPGNNDIANKLMDRIWRERFGRSYYHFAYRNVLFLCVNTEDTKNGFISHQQIEYFREVLKTNVNVRWTLVFMHQPLWRSQGSGWLELELLLAERDYTVFAGHLHRYVKSKRNDRTYYILATTGGRNLGLAHRFFGYTLCQFDHIVWVTMTDDGPVIANLLLDGILDDEPCLQ